MGFTFGSYEFKEVVECDLSFIAGLPRERSGSSFSNCSLGGLGNKFGAFGIIFSAMLATVLFALPLSAFLLVSLLFSELNGGLVVLLPWIVFDVYIFTT